MPNLTRRVIGAVLALLAGSGGLLFAASTASALPPRPQRLYGDARHSAPFAPTLLPSTAGSPVDCVILSPDSFTDVYQRLADYQTRAGKPTVVRALSTVRAADPRSNDLAQAVRSFLKSARDLWGIRWAILAGDHDAIPLRIARVTFSQILDIPTDAYYADLDGTWDANGNGIYGEVADSLDMEPDIAVGRLSAGTRAEAGVLVDKAMRYATAPLLPMTGRQLILAEVLFPSNWHPGELVQVDGGIEGESLRTHAPPCAVVDRYYENTERFPGVPALNKASALSALSRGYNVVYHVGHGSRSQLSVGQDLLTLDDMAGITNGDSAAIWISSNCTSAAVDFDCVAERLVRRAGGGALAYVGATRDEWPGPSALFNNVLEGEIFQIGSLAYRPTLGEGVENARASLLPAARSESQERWSYFETILLGVPSLPVWRCPPAALTVSRPSTVPLSAGSFLVTVGSGGSPAESALVIAWKAGEEYQAVLTNAAGQAVVPFHPGTTGSFSLAVTRRDAVPYLDSLTVTSAAPAHFALLGASPSDVGAGDGNGLIEAGEAFAVTGTVKNTGQTSSSGALTLEIKAATSGLVVDKGIAQVASLAPGAQLSIPDSLRAHALAVPNAPRIERLLFIARDALRADTSEIDVEVTVPSLLLVRSTFSDTNGNGILEAGENATFSWTVGNEGDGRARNPTLRAKNPAVGISLTDSTGTLSSIAPGGTVESPNVVIHATNNPVGRLFDLELKDAYGHTWTFPIDRGVPSKPGNLRVVGYGADRIFIAWDQILASDLLGYVVLRTGLDTTAVPVEASALPVRRSPLYENTGLAPLTRYYFAVAAVDSSGNRSVRSPFLLASTSPQAVPGWPAQLAASTSSSPCFGDLDGDGKLEIVVGADMLYVFRSDGTDWINGDANPITVGVFSTLLHNVASTPAVADVNLDGVPEIIAASWNDSLIAVFKPDGTLLPGWPKKGAAPFWSAPSVGDIDTDGNLDIVVGSNTSLLYAWHANGTEVADGDANPATDGVYFVPVGTVISSPAIADLNGNGTREVIFGTSAARVYALSAGVPLPGWPFIGSGLMSSSPAVGDIVPGGGLEVAMAAANDSVYVLTALGQRAPGWPRALGLTPGNGRVPSPVLAPLQRHLGNPALDVVICGIDGRVRAYDPSGTILPGWSNVTLGGGTEASPAVADLDGDGALEVLIGAEDRRLYAFRSDGTPVNGFPIEIGAEVRSTPAIWDVDKNGGSDVFLAGWDGKVYAWRYPGSFLSSGMAWPMFRHDNWHTGVASFPILTSADPVPSPDPVTEIPGVRASLAQNRPNPFNPITVIGLTVPGSEPAPVTVRIFTADGRLVRTLVSRRLDPGYHEIRWDGRGDRGEALGTGVYLYRAEIGSASFARKMALLR